MPDLASLVSLAPSAFNPPLLQGRVGATSVALSPESLQHNLAQRRTAFGQRVGTAQVGGVDRTQMQLRRAAHRPTTSPATASPTASKNWPAATASASTATANCSTAGASSTRASNAKSPSAATAPTTTAPWCATGPCKATASPTNHGSMWRAIWKPVGWWICFQTHGASRRRCMWRIQAGDISRRARCCWGIWRGCLGEGAGLGLMECLA